MTTGFFDEQLEQSRVKAELVEKYFFAWANVVKGTVGPSGKLAYIDLFAGPGRYKDGAASVPVMILEKAISDPFLRNSLVALFNDKDQNNTQSLESQISKIAGVEKLKHQPTVMNEEVGTNIVSQFEKMNLVPTLFFVDPWGYKGLSLKLINSVLKNWGCDCIFFFNYNRINPGLSNPYVRHHMEALFGAERVPELAQKLSGLTPALRELTIVEALSEALKELGGKYILPFTFKREDGSRTTHYLIFVSKHVKGYEVMKEIMAKASSGNNEGVASFSYCPADASFPMLFEFARPLSELGTTLCSEFSGETMTMLEVYDRHHVGRRYIKKNYKDALNRLEAQGKLVADPPAHLRPKRKGEPTFSDKVRVTFIGTA